MLLAINKGIREVCLIYLVSYLIYLNFILYVDDIWYMRVCALGDGVGTDCGIWYYRLCEILALATGSLIIKKSFIVGCLSFSLIGVNLLGAFLFWHRYPLTIYDNIALTVILLQLLTLSIRTLNGILNKSSGSSFFGRAFRLFVMRITYIDSWAKNKKTVEEMA